MNIFGAEVEKRISSEPFENAIDPNSKWDLLKTTIIQTAKEHTLGKPGMKDFITPATSQIILERRELKERGTSSLEDQERYSKLSREVQTRFRQDYDAYINNICQELEQNSLKHETKQLFQKVKELTNSRSIKPFAIEYEEKRLLIDMTQILERWKSYCQSLYDTGEPTSRLVEWIVDEPNILRSEVKNALKSLKREVPRQRRHPRRTTKELRLYRDIDSSRHM